MPSLLPYHEPSITTILKQSSFFLVLNAVNHVLDTWIYAGLVGQILVGVAWGMPGGQILETSAQEVIVELGYIGLILMVFEGGLSTSFSALRANIMLSTVVAITGIVAPLGLSFVLSPMIGATSLQAFAAGAALCSTSLGTTFTLLGTSGLSSSRLGVVLTSAAMMDDVVGLIMVQVINNLGSTNSFNPVTVIRPVFVSMGLAIMLPLLCQFVVLPITKRVSKRREDRDGSRIANFLSNELVALSVYTAALISVVAGATYAGSSALLGAYIAGAMISWWDAESSQLRPSTSPGSATPATDSVVPGMEMSPSQDVQSTSDGQNIVHSHSSSDAELFEKFYEPALRRVFKPLFFVGQMVDCLPAALTFLQASIGFSIPITQMFSGSVVWRGVVYAILMIIGKLMCGLWLLRVPSLFEMPKRLIQALDRMLRCNKAVNGPSRPTTRKKKNAAKNPLSIYPGLILGSAMVARGEIGYLISSLAETGGVFRNNSQGAIATSEEPSDIFLIITWAITLCTIAGPVTMGLLVNRVRRLEREASRDGQQRHRTTVLGTWGVNTT